MLPVDGSPCAEGWWAMMSQDRAAADRAAMVERLARGGAVDPCVLDAMARVPRERFVPQRHESLAYDDRPVPIGNGQTVSAPSMVALMATALQLTGTDTVLEVGTGSGYAAAVLGCCAVGVVTIERHRGLAERARALLADLGYTNVEVRHGDGSRGAADRAPFDGITVAAMADDVPASLVGQLTCGGVLVCPVGVEGVGHLLRLQHGHRQRISPVRFVPLITDDAEHH